jgi:hypothetical protein
MSESDKSKRPGTNAPQKREVLTRLPAHRPQRVTARRAATRKRAPAADTPAPDEPTGAKDPKPAAKTAKRATSKKRAVASSAGTARHVANPPPAPAPKQGFESEEVLAGVAVKPPSNSELLISTVELAVGAAQSTIVRGGRLLAGALTRLPRI